MNVTKAIIIKLTTAPGDNPPTGYIYEWYTFDGSNILVHFRLSDGSEKSIISGATGATGVTGATGSIGSTGATGVAGATGEIGLTGASGVDGATGLIGATGVAGSSGVDGLVGATGIDGASGASGATGVQGASGIGATGIDGASGASGATGVQGASGSIGATGIDGASGASGATGVQGTSGIGATGIDGASGASGATGVQGASGTGATGVDGASGASGATGVQGASGSIGATGIDGASGASGATGIDGASGATGAEGPSRLVNRIYVGATGNYTTVKAAVDWFNASASSDTEILIDGGHFPIADTVIVNNATYSLQIAGLGSEVSFIEAATGLTGKPMFNLKSNCDIHRITATGSTLASYGTAANENFVTFDTTASIYSEITDLFIDTFKIAIADLKGIDLYLFNFSIIDCGTGVLIDNTTASIVSVQDIEVGNFENCSVGISLAQNGSGATSNFYLAHIVFEQDSGDTAILYDGSSYAIGTYNDIFNCTYNNIGTFISGFDFSLTSGRDANVEIIGNAGCPDNVPHSKINISDNVTTTTCTAARTYYKVNGLNSKVHITFNDVATSGTFTITVAGQTTTGIAYDASDATIKAAVEALSNVTTVSVVVITASQDFTIEFATSGEGWGIISVDVSSLGTVTSVMVIPNHLECRIAVLNNKITYLSDHAKDGLFWITGNLSVNQSNRNINVAVKKNGTGSALAPFTVRTTTSNQPYPFSLTLYSETIMKDDYCELFISSNNAGDIVTISDVYWMVSSR
jgi:hypothetical protein